MNLYRPNYLKRTLAEGLHSVPSGVLSLELSDTDVHSLVDPNQGYATSRFMAFDPPVTGWSPEDKVHVWLKEQLDDEDERLVEVSLDPGGDLYFSIFKGDPLSESNERKSYHPIREVVTSDPCQTLVRLGITTIRLYGLPDLAAALGE